MPFSSSKFSASLLSSRDIQCSTMALTSPKLALALSSTWSSRNACRKKENERAKKNKKKRVESRVPTPHEKSKRHRKAKRTYCIYKTTVAGHKVNEQNKRQTLPQQNVRDCLWAVALAHACGTYRITRVLQSMHVRTASNTRTRSEQASKQEHEPTSCRQQSPARFASWRKRACGLCPPATRQCRPA